MANMNLSDLAKKAAEANSEIEYFQEPTERTVADTTKVAPSTPVEDDVPSIFIGSNNPMTPPAGESVTTNTSTPMDTQVNPVRVDPVPKAIMPNLDDMDVSTPEEAGLSQKDLEDLAPHLPPEERSKMAAEMMAEKSKYVKQLILDGFTPKEAEQAAENRFKKEATNKDTEYAEKNPEIGVVRIDKTDTAVEDLKLTEEEHEKLVPTKAIKLVLVEDADLKNIEIENVSADHKVDYIRNLEGSLSKYSVPIPIYGDYMSFRGAQLIQIANLESRDDDRLEDDLNRKASLIYSKLIGGTLLKKSDENGKSIMNYNEFTNKFSYMDIDMAIYGILCASNPEEGSTQLTCNKCNHSFEHKYNFKRLMTQEGLSDEIKQRYEDILTYRTNNAMLGKLHAESNRARRYKSPFTNNIYDIGIPSIARMIDVFKRINQEDSIMVHNSIFASFINALYIYNQNTGKYLEITDGEVDLMLDTISDIPQDDITMLQKQIATMSYSPRFMISGECPSCGTHYEIPVNVDNLLFFKQRDLQREIE